MFVKVFAALYELRLKYHKLRLKRSELRTEEARWVYKATFRNYYMLSDEYVRIQNEQRNMPTHALGEGEKNRIDATGGRRSVILLDMDKQEKVVTNLDRRVTRTKARIASLVEKQQAMPSRRTRSVSASVAGVLRLQ